MKHHLFIAATAVVLTMGTTAAAQPVTLTPIGTHHTGLFDEGASEIAAFDERTDRVFAINAADVAVDVLDISDPTNPTKIDTIDASGLGGSANSVAVQQGLVAVAIEADDKQDNGVVAFYNSTTLAFLGSVGVGALPDMVAFTPNGRYVLVANEGEPNGDYDDDPVGSVSIIDLRRGPGAATVATAGFGAFNGQEANLRAQGIRIFGPGASAAQDFEPEYIAVSGNSRTAWVVLQENNAIAEIDIRSATVTDLWPLGTKNFDLPRNEFDPSDRDDEIALGNWPVQGFYMPDGIASYQSQGRTYLVTANEGDARDYDEFAEEERIKDLDLDLTVFPDAEDLQEDEAIGRLTATTANGDIDEDDDFDVLYIFGARSFSIWDEHGNQVFDSGSDFEEITGAAFPDDFNSTNYENDSFDNRSDNKGPEPEGVALGQIGGRTFAFIGLERIGGVMVYDITDPTAPIFITYANNRNFGVDAQLEDDSTNPAVGDLGPEGLAFIPAPLSPSHKDLLVVGNEISGTTTIYEIGVKIERSGGFRRR
jgi:2',3'-cyclic-nucleotide 2'-phosphodiesterase/3'-nucleotidase/5'-nucleotidase